MNYTIRSTRGEVAVAGDRVARSAPRDAPVVDVGAAWVRPGLINAHDHLHRNHFPRLGAPPYPDAYAWGRDLHARWPGVVERGRDVPRGDALLFGALKNLVAGVTTVVHHDAWEPAFETGFPVRVPRIRHAHSLGFDPDPVRSAAGDWSRPLCIHLAEGTTPADAEEVRLLEALGLLDAALVAVHAVGVDRDGVDRLRRADAAVVVCPSSNEFLLGRTAPPALLESGVDVLLGSDSLLTAEGTLLDELRIARQRGLLDDERLMAAVGATAARRLGLERPGLEPGAPADLVCLRRPLLEADASDVVLVVVGGRPVLGALQFAPLFAAAGAAVERLTIGGSARLVVAPLASVAERIVGAWPESERIFSSSPTPCPP